MIDSRFIHITTNDRIPFLSWLKYIPLCATHHIFGTSVNGHLDFFYVLAVVKCRNEHWSACVLLNYGFLRVHSKCIWMARWLDRVSHLAWSAALCLQCLMWLHFSDFHFSHGYFLSGSHVSSPQFHPLSETVSTCPADIFLTHNINF